MNCTDFNLHYISLENVMTWAYECGLGNLCSSGRCPVLKLPEAPMLFCCHFWPITGKGDRVQKDWEERKDCSFTGNTVWKATVDGESPHPGMGEEFFFRGSSV